MGSRSLFVLDPLEGDLPWDGANTDGAAGAVAEWEFWGPDGWLYFVVYPSAESTPSAAQIKAGQRQSGSAAVASGSGPARSFDGEQVFTDAATGLTAGTNYTIAFVWTDGANDSDVETGTFATSAGGGGVVVPIFEMHYRLLRAA